MTMPLTPQAEQHMREVQLGDALNSMNAPAPYASRVAILLPFTTIEYVEEIDPTDTRERIDPEDKRDVPDAEKRRIPIHISERRRISVPYVRATDGKGNLLMRPAPDGRGKMDYVPLVDMIRSLADTGDRDGRLPNGGLRYKLFGSAH